MIDRLNTIPAGCFMLLAMSAITATGQAETELEFSYSDEWSVVSAPPPSGPYRAVHVDPRVPGQGVAPPVTTAFDAGKQADIAGAPPQPETGGEFVQQAIDAPAAVMEQLATPAIVEAPAAAIVAEEQALPSSVVTAIPDATPADTGSVQAVTAQPPAEALAASPAAPAVQPPAGHASAGIPAGETPLASQLPMPGMMDSMMPPAAGHPAIRQPVPPAASGGDAPTDMSPPVPGQYGQMRSRQPAYGYPQSGGQGGGYPQSGWQGGGYPQSGRQGGGYPQTGWQGGGYPQSGWQGGGHPGYMNASPYGYYRGPADMSGTEVPPPADYQTPPYYGGNAYPAR